jgi:hypothetical protein
LRVADRHFSASRADSPPFIRKVALLTVLALAVSGAVTAACAAQKAQPRSWRAATDFPRPPFHPTRRIVVRSADRFWKAWRDLRPGEEIDVRGVTFTGEAAFVNKRLPRWAEVHFEAGTKFVGYPTAQNYGAVFLKNDAHIRFYGGDVSDRASGGMAGTGITVHDSTHVLWWNFVVHDVGGEGVYLAGVTRPSTWLDFKGEVYDWGRNLAFDPNREKGTGIHGVNVDDSYYGVTHSRLAFYVHDGPTGAGMSIGGGRATDGPQYNTIYLSCRNLTMAAKVQVAGNCIQFWGENDLHNTIEFLQARNLSGRPFDANGLYPGQSLATNTVEYGRAAHTNLNPVLGRAEYGIPAHVRWDRRGGTVFHDVSG